MNLQLALIVLGAVVLTLVVVLSYAGGRFSLKKVTNGWLNRLLSVDMLIERAASVLRLRKFDHARQREPSLVPADSFELGKEPTTTSDPLPQEEAGADPPVGSGVPRDIAGLTPQDGIGSGPLRIDYWARLTGEGSVSRDAVLGLYREFEIRLDHPRAVHGRTHPGNVWLDLEQAGSDELFTDLVVSLQLADHRGPVDEAELTRFNTLVYGLAEGLNRRCHLEESLEDSLPQAQRLDRFCRAYDMLAILNIEPLGDSSFGGRELERVMQRSGMRLGDRSIFHFYDPRTGASQFSLANRHQPGQFDYPDLVGGAFRGLTMFMSIPCAVNPSATFAKMISVAEYVSSELNGSVTDPDGSRLSSAHLSLIQRQVNGIGEAMRRLGIVPGSEEALRLF